MSRRRCAILLALAAARGAWTADLHFLEHTIARFRAERMEGATLQQRILIT